MKTILKVSIGLFMGIAAINFQVLAAENMTAVVSQAPNESGRVRVTVQAPQNSAPKEMDLALIPEPGKNAPEAGTRGNLHVGDKVMIGFKQNENTGMYETSVTKLTAAPGPQKEQ